MRIVFDTNVLISAFISNTGTASKALRWAAENAIVLSCEVALCELNEKLALEKFKKYLPDEDRMHQLLWYSAAIEKIRVPAQHGVTASVDPDDNIFLALAKIGKADFVVSGDKKHLLSLGSFDGVPIMSPADFLARVGAGQ